MSMFQPNDHASNGPETWRVVKLRRDAWAVTTADGVTLEHATTKRLAEALCEPYSWLVAAYEKEGRWYAGEDVSPWRPFRECSTYADSPLALADAEAMAS